MAHCDLCGVTYLSERGHTCESVSGSTAIGFARATAAINTTHIAQAFPCPDCGQPKVTGSVCDTSRCRARAAPTPAAPAGSGAICDCGAELTMCSSCAVADYQAAHPDCRTCVPISGEAAERAREAALDAAWVDGYTTGADPAWCEKQLRRMGHRNEEPYTRRAAQRLLADHAAHRAAPGGETRGDDADL